MYPFCRGGREQGTVAPSLGLSSLGITCYVDLASVGVTWLLIAQFVRPAEDVRRCRDPELGVLACDVDELE